MELIEHYFPDLTSEQRRQFALLGSLYATWNARINVISRKDQEQLYLRHVLHSLAIARYEVIYDEAENTTADLLDGKITFHQYITPYTPAEDIEDVIEFDPDALTTALS